MITARKLELYYYFTSSCPDVNGIEFIAIAIAMSKLEEIKQNFTDAPPSQFVL